MAVAAKEYRQGKERLLAACDEELLGRTLRDNGVKFEVSPAFYDGDRITDEEFRAMLAHCTVANLVGERVVRLAIEAGLVDEENTMRIEGVPHAQYALMF